MGLLKYLINYREKQWTKRLTSYGLEMKKTLRGFKKGGFITSENSAMIDRLSLTGAVTQRGFHVEKITEGSAKGKLFIRPTARTTKYGKALERVL